MTIEVHRSWIRCQKSGFDFDFDFDINYFGGSLTLITNRLNDNAKNCIEFNAQKMLIFQPMAVITSTIAISVYLPSHSHFNSLLLFPIFFSLHFIMIIMLLCCYSLFIYFSFLFKFFNSSFLRSFCLLFVIVVARLLLIQTVLYFNSFFSFFHFEHFFFVNV